MPNKSQRRTVGLFTSAAQAEEEFDPVKNQAKFDTRKSMKNKALLNRFMANAITEAGQEDYDDYYDTEDDERQTLAPR